MNIKERLKKDLPFLLIALFLAPVLGNFVWVVIIGYLLFITFSQFKLTNFNFKNMENPIDLDKQKQLKKMRTGTIWGVVIVLLLILLFSSITIIEAGETGVYSLFGKVNEEEKSSGLHLVIPLAKVTKMSVRTQDYTMSSAKQEGVKRGVDAITVLTKEGLKVDLDITILYHLNEDKASSVYEDVGLNYQEKIIRPAIRSTIRKVIAEYDAKVVYSEKRKEAADRIMEELTEILEPRGIVVEETLLRNVKLPSKLADSIEQKLQAEQEAEKMEFVLDKERKEKERKIIAAEGQKESQRIINESLTPNYLQYLYIKNLEDREGTIYVPTSPDNGVPMFKNLSQ